MTTKTKRIVKVRFGADGKMRQLNSSGKAARIVRGRVDVRRLEEPGAFESDADVPRLTKRELREMKPVRVKTSPDLTRLRQKLRLSQAAFAQLFAIPLATLKDWEQGRRSPDAPSRAYLRVIEKNPNAVRMALVDAAE